MTTLIYLSPGVIDALTERLGDVEASPTENTLLERLKANETALTTLATRIGEVQGSPTSNSLLDRLKELATRIGAVEASPTTNTLADRLLGLKTGIVLAAGTAEIGKLAAGTAVVGKVRLVNAGGTEVTDPDTAALIVQESGLVGVAWSEKMYSSHKQCMLGQGGTQPTENTSGQLLGFYFINTGSGRAHCHIHDFWYRNQTSSVDVNLNILFEPAAGPNGVSYMEFKNGLAFSAGLRFYSSNPCECYFLYSLD